MQIRSSSGQGQILETVINKILIKDRLIKAAKVAKDIEGESGAEAVLTAGLIDARENGVELEDADIDFVLSKVYQGEKSEKTAQMGTALRGLGKGLGGAWQGIKDIGQGVWNKAKGVGQGIANLPQAMEQKGYEMQQGKYQTQLQALQTAAQGMSGQYQRLMQTLGNLGRTTVGLQNAAQKGQLTPDAVNTAQGLVKSMMDQLNTLNQAIATVSKYQNIQAPQAPVKNQPISPFSPAMQKPVGQPQTLSF